MGKPKRKPQSPKVVTRNEEFAMATIGQHAAAARKHRNRAKYNRKFKYREEWE